MYAEADSLSSVGFRHVIEDGLALLNGKNLAATRKSFVLGDLARIASEAKQCSELAHGNSWLFTQSSKEAYELFSLLDRRLSQEGQPWREWLEAAASAFSKMLQGEAPITEDERTQTNRFLQELLNCVSGLSRIHLSSEDKDGALLLSV